MGAAAAVVVLVVAVVVLAAVPGRITHASPPPRRSSVARAPHPSTSGAQVLSPTPLTITLGAPVPVALPSLGALLLPLLVLYRKRNRALRFCRRKSPPPVGGGFYLALEA